MSGKLTRRRLIAMLCAAPLLPGAARARPGCSHRPGARKGPHPEPRPGITAERVVPDDQLTHRTDTVLAAFAAVRLIPHIVDGIRCHCGCADLEESYSLLSCYEGGGMAQHCLICQGQARMALRLHEEGRDLDAIRVAVDARYG